MEEKKENKLGVMPIGKLLVSMSLPTIFSMFIQAMYNIVDSIYVAQIGENALTAVSLAFPIQNLIIAMAVGTGVGINSLISRRLGEKRGDQAEKAASHGVVIAVLEWLIFLVFGLFFTPIFFEAFTTDATIISMGISYTSVVSIFSVGVFIQIAIEKVLQATGSMIYPMILQLTGAIINIVLDPILIFGWLGMPAMGVKGAAVATVIGQLAAMILAVTFIAKGKCSVHIKLKGFKFEKNIIKDIFAVGFPAIVMQSIGSVMVMGLNNILMVFSSSAVAVLGVYFKLQSFVFMPVFGLSQGAMPIMGYNYGARNKHRLMETLKLSGIISVSIMAIGTIIFQLIPRQLLMLFQATEEMYVIGIPALRTISSCFIFAALGITFSNFFQAVGHGANSLLISIMRQMVILLPAAWLFARFATLQMVWFAFPIAEIVAFITSLFLLFFVYKKEIISLESKSE